MSHGFGNWAVRGKGEGGVPSILGSTSTDRNVPESHEKANKKKNDSKTKNHQKAEIIIEKRKTFGIYQIFINGTVRDKSDIL